MVRVHQVSLKYYTILSSFIKTQLLASSSQVGGSTAIQLLWCMWPCTSTFIFFWLLRSLPLLLLLKSRRHLLHLDCFFLSLYPFVMFFIKSTNQHLTPCVHAGKTDLFFMLPAAIRIHWKHVVFL